MKNNKEHHASIFGFDFDNRISAGHILTFIAMLVSIITAYNSLDKRLAVMETILPRLEKSLDGIEAKLEKQNSYEQS